MLARVAVQLQPILKVPVKTARQMAPLVSFFVNQLGLVALIFGLWRLGSDVGLTGSFFIGSGLLSHWQVWLALATGLFFSASHLNGLSTPPDSDSL